MRQLCDKKRGLNGMVLWRVVARVEDASQVDSIRSLASGNTAARRRPLIQTHTQNLQWWSKPYMVATKNIYMLATTNWIGKLLSWGIILGSDVQWRL